MPNYRRNVQGGATYFFTVVTHGRLTWLCSDAARAALRESIAEVRATRPFAVDAWVLLPDHLHCLWTLPAGDGDFSTRWRLIKSGVTKRLGTGGGASAEADTPYRKTGFAGPMTQSRRRRGERGVWQRRFWEHTIRDERDFATHCDYIHFNAAKHGLVPAPRDWPWSTFHRFVQRGVYPSEWGRELPGVSVEIGGE